MDKEWVFELITGGFVAAWIAVASGKRLIPYLTNLKYGQSIREDGPRSHQAKSGTPTMGGIMIALGTVITTIIIGWIADKLSVSVGLALFIFLGHLAIGFADDYIKIVKKRNLGLRAWQKLLGQIIIAGLIVYIGEQFLDLDTAVWVPFANIHLEIGYAYYLLVILVLVGTSNSVNLTDGLDGLAAGTVAITGFVYLLICLIQQRMDLAIFITCMTTATLGFYHYNKYPAKIFMGDTGSLALGGAIAGIAILTGTELLLPLIGIIFVAEAMSVIIQVISFKTRGKRVFRMSPLHHHFELGGWSEVKVVKTFWMVTLVAGALAVLIYNLSVD